MDNAKNGTTSTDIKNEIVDLLLLDAEQCLQRIHNEKIEYDLNEKQINSIVKAINNNKNAETIANNMYDLCQKESLPKFIKDICECYKEELRFQNKKVAPPENYAVTSIAYIRSQQIETLEKMEASEALLSELLESSKKARLDVDRKINKSKDSIILLTVTVLGIFSSLTFSLSGSLGVLNSVLSTEGPFAEMLFKFAIIGLFVANLVFLLLYTIAKMNNKSIAMHCNKCPVRSEVCESCEKRSNSDKEQPQYVKECYGCEHRNTSCQECTKKHKFFCKLQNKFGYIFIINVLCVSALVVSLLLGVLGLGDFVFADKGGDSTASTSEVSSAQQSTTVQSENEHTTPTNSTTSITTNTSIPSN